jgi:hypothetical protein
VSLRFPHEYREGDLTMAVYIDRNWKVWHLVILNCVACASAFGAVELSGTVCMVQSNAGCDDCLPYSLTGTESECGTATCMLAQCGGSDIDWRACEQSTSGGPCSPSGEYVEACNENCKIWTCGCSDSSGNCAFANCTGCGGTGGQDAVSIQPYSTCT